MSAGERVRPLVRTRQIRDFTTEPISEEALHALTEVARWTGSSRNEQPWQFIVIRDLPVLRHLAEVGTPQTRALRTAAAAIATVLPADATRHVQDAYDDGRVAERLLIAAGLLDLGGAIVWVRADVRAAVRAILSLPAGRFVRSIVGVGHPTEAALRPKAERGTARLPRDQVIFEERWPLD